jgi:site-specific recombinase XerC
MASSFVHPFSASLLGDEQARHHRRGASPRSLALRIGRAALSALVEARRRKAEREIALFLEQRGSRLTDETERQIGLRFGAGAR